MVGGSLDYEPQFPLQKDKESSIRGGAAWEQGRGTRLGQVGPSNKSLGVSSGFCTVRSQPSGAPDSHAREGNKSSATPRFVGALVAQP